MTTFEIYFLGILSNLSEIMAGIGFLLALGGAAGYIISKTEEEEDKFSSLIKKSFITGLILLFFALIIPDKKTMFAMLTIPQITNQEWVKELPANTQKVINKFVTDYLGEDKK